MTKSGGRQFASAFPTPHSKFWATRHPLPRVLRRWSVGTLTLHSVQWPKWGTDQVPHRVNQATINYTKCNGRYAHWFSASDRVVYSGSGIGRLNEVTLRWTRLREVYLWVGLRVDYCPSECCFVVRILLVMLEFVVCNVMLIVSYWCVCICRAQ